MEQRLDSKDPAVVRSALTDLWRENTPDSMMMAAGHLDSAAYGVDAAFALCVSASEITDKVVLNKLGASMYKSGCLYYFLMRRTKKSITDQAELLLKNAALSAEDVFLLNAITGNFEKAEALFEKADDISGAKKEFLILLGEKKYGPAYGFLKKTAETDISMKPFAVWAMHMIKPENKIRMDKTDRVITQNAYWKKYGDQPLMPSVNGTFKSVHTANPDILTTNDMIYFYYRGGDGHDRIAMASVPYNSFDGTNFNDYPRNPVINIGNDSFDDLAALDPAAVFFRDRVFLYYSGLGKKSNDSVGLATSKDFYNFTKAPRNPVITGRAPAIVLKEGIIYMYYVMPNEYNGYSVFLATSDDGYNFVKFGTVPVFTYGTGDAWDSRSVTVPRIREKDGVYYMFYAGDDRYRDYPPYFGVAFSYDLVHWYRSTQNPVFSRSKKGAWDDGGIWFPEVFPYKGKLYLYYEGWGGGESHEKEYGAGGHSQIGMAVSEYDLADML